MFRLLLLFILSLFFGLNQSALAQGNSNVPDSLGLPGDNFNLNAVLFKFQQCKTLEEFELELNKKENQINNLDLNNDQVVDYIKVEDHVEGNTHAISMKALLGSESIQDIAVIVVEKNADGEVSVQAIGDEDLYGKDYIVEPINSKNTSNSNPPGTPNPGYKLDWSDTIKSANGQNVTIHNYYQTTNNNIPNQSNEPASSQYQNGVNYWPLWGSIFGPRYVVYVSPYYYGYYPGWFSPYPIVYFHSYYMFHRRAIYYRHYAFNRHYHSNYYQHTYYPVHRQRVNTRPVYRPSNSVNPNTRPGAPIPPKQVRPRPSMQPTPPPARNTRPNPINPNNGNTRPSSQPPIKPILRKPNSGTRPSNPSPGGFQNKRTTPQAPLRENKSNNGGTPRRK
jgi:hypothetical protein